MGTPAAAIIPAAGSGTRMNSDTPKQFLMLGGKPILIHTVTAFKQCSDIGQIIVVVPEAMVNNAKELLREYRLDEKKISVIGGGARRQDSVLAGLHHVSPGIDIVLVHDGARPLVSPTLISRCYREVIKSGAALAAIPVKDTIKKAGPNHFVEDTIDRSFLWSAQTPQGARKELLNEGYRLLDDNEVTDEASILERAGIPVALVNGSETNLKITHPDDLQLAEKIMNSKKTTTRIGHGFDAHRFAEGRKLILGGIQLDHPLGLAGHSDADVLTHALCDALLGALGKGDLGTHFPDNDDTFKDISSLTLLDKIIGMAGEEKLSLVNCDITVICQKPKLAPHIPAMKAVLSRHCQVARSSVNIKATTTEKMGYTGREEGISCHAVVLLDSSPQP